jgi:hypothetical protein
VLSTFRQKKKEIKIENNDVVLPLPAPGLSPGEKSSIELPLKLNIFRVAL